ncbi:unnamed protein product [Oppiella nova]|uniref:C2H2-type domain-containing protein n=1 Tax=Oppiella nova TaxID=334625 RepID=A0A7R9M2F0_9ACAR|nr:unnamed protein product [Oppiella nova]CAG2169503.1 unnamed protein product [Oppiella nova]
MHEQQQRINAQNELQSAAYSQSPPPPQPSQHFLDHQLMQPFTQTYPTGTSITSIDGLPILKRKRGRPPKNKTIEMPQSIYSNFKFPKNELSPQMSVPLGISPFGLAAALYGNSNIPLPASSALSDMIAGSGVADDTKTIPIPLMLPYTKSNIQEGFIVFDEGFPCTDNLCKYFCQKHYHCSKPRCYYVTNRSETLIMHSKDFHDSIDIMEGFVHFDSGVDCRIAGCVHNKVNRHYHCTRNGCNYSFIRYTQMSQHEDKHKHENSVEPTNANCDPAYFAKSKSSATASQASSHSDDDRESLKSPFNTNNNSIVNNCNNKMQTVKAKGTYYPLSSLSQRKLSHSITSTIKSEDESDDEDIDDCDSDVPNSEIIKKEALNHLLQDQSAFNLNTHTNRNLFSPSDEKHLQYSPSNGCGLPFCKLKRRDHFHCNAFSSFTRLLPHSAKHSGAPKPVPVYLSGRSPSPPIKEENETEDEEEDEDMSLGNISTQLPHSTPNIYSFMNNWVNTPSSSTLLNNKLMSVSSTITSSSPLINLSHKNNDIPGLTSTSKLLRDEPVPTGYLRFRFNEDCGYLHCGYREHQTHFHCMRKDCGYSFCDKTRFVQHTARHERLDTLMGGDFHQFRSNVSCGRSDCMYANTMASMANKASHFHCIKCDFVCTDTNKVVAHRRQHAKMDNITAAGFEKYTPTQDCKNDNCNYNTKQTHYHCLKCHYAVLGLSQMSSHKYKHTD